MAAPSRSHRALAMVCSAFLLSVLAAASAAAQQPLWRAFIGDGWKSMSITPAGAVLVETDSGVSAFTADSGRRLWYRPDATDLDYIAGTPLAVVGVAAHHRVIDVVTGQDRWNFGALALADERYLPLPEHRLMLVDGADSTGRTLFYGVSLDSNEVRWRDDTLGDARLRKAVPIAKHVAALSLGDSVVVLDADEDGLIAVRLATGAVAWRVPESIAHLDKSTGPLQLVGGTLYLPYERTLLALDAATGAVRWKLAKDFPGPARELAPSRAGLVAGGVYTRMSVGIFSSSMKPRLFLAVVDTATGKWLMEPVEMDGASAFVVRGDTIFQPVHNGFRVYDASSGKGLLEADLPELGGGEDPLAIEELDGGDFVLVSPQNLVRVDPRGHVAYHRYLKAPGASFLAKAAGIGLTVAFGAASYRMGSPGGTYFIPTGPMTLALQARHHATEVQNRYAYIYTSELADPGDGFDLVRLDKRDGAEHGRVRLADRSPRYLVEPESGIVVVVRGSQLAGYPFPSP